MNVEIRALPNNTWFEFNDNVVHAWGDYYGTACGSLYDNTSRWVPIALYAADEDKICEDCLKVELVRELGK